MDVYVTLLLAQIILLSCVVPAEYSTVQEVSPRCKKRNKNCAEFQNPGHDVGEFNCTLNNKNCDYVCLLTCPRQTNGLWMTVSNHRFSKEMYVCSAGTWKRKDTPKAFCVAKMPVKEVRQNFHHVTEVNSLVNTLFSTSYLYMAMASYYERADVALPGFSEVMTDLWQTEMRHARDLMSYVNKRGGYITLTEIPRPSSHEKLLLRTNSRPGLAGLEAALNVTRHVNDLALDLHKATTQHKRSTDPHLKFYLEDGVISHKVDTIKKLADMIRKLQTFSDEDYDIGEYLMDLEIRKDQAQRVA